MKELEGYTVNVAPPPAMVAVRAIRHRAFSRDGQDAPDDEHDARPNSRSYLLRSCAGEPVGTIRISVHSAAFDWLPIPAFDIFGDEFAAIGSGLAVVQSSLFAVSAEWRGMALLPKLLLIREVLRNAFEFRADLVATVVRNQGSQMHFYRRMGFRSIGPAKIHPLANRETALIGVSPDVFLSSVRGSRTLALIGDFDEMACGRSESGS